MATFGVDQSLNNSSLYQHIFMINVKKSYKYAGQCDNIQHCKEIM